jgi:predicted permease
MIFISIYNSDLRSVVDSRLITFCVLSTFVFFLITAVVSWFSIKNKSVIGAFIQGSCRSNYILIGLPLINNLYGVSNAEVVQKSSFVVAIIIPLFNVLSIIILSIFSSKRQSINLLKNLKIIVTNPLIISVFIAVIFNLLDIVFPRYLLKTISYISDIAIPLALLDIGASITFSSISNTFSYAIAATFLKIIFAPTVFTAIAYFSLFKNSDLVILYVLFASPTAVASYIMAKNMDNNAELAASIVVLTTLGSIVTIFVGIFVLKSMGIL